MLAPQMVVISGETVEPSGRETEGTEEVGH